MKEKIKIPFAKPDITLEDIQAVNNFLLNCDGQLTDGEMVSDFENKFSNYIDKASSYCIATSSCTSALHLAYMALGIGSGDEVIVPAMTHAATAHAVELVGAKSIFIDCKSDGNIDEFLIRKELEGNRSIKVISVMHYVGNPCLMDLICDRAKEYGVRVVEDCALALGSRLKGKHVGLLGDCGAFSFYPAKHITTGEGGMFVTTDYDLYRRAKSICRFGKEDERSSSDYNIDKLGSNFRMSELQAVLGISQLKRRDKFLEVRQRNLSKLLYLNNGININIFGSSYCAILKCDTVYSRNEIIDKLKKKEIQASIYYPHPIPRLKYYANKYGYAPIRYPEAIRIADTTIALPIGPHVTEEMMSYMIECLKEIL